MGSKSRDRGGGECWGPGGRTFVTPLRYTNCSSVPPWRPFYLGQLEPTLVSSNPGQLEPTTSLRAG